MISSQISIFAFYASRAILFILIGLSIFTVAFFIERMIFFLRNFLKNGDVFSLIERANTKEEVRFALEKELKAESIVVLNSLSSELSSKDDFSKKVTAHLNIEKEKWERFVAFLGSVGSNAPFIGLLGTVLGIMKSFADLGTISKGGPQVVMGGDLGSSCCNCCGTGSCNSCHNFL